MGEAGLGPVEVGKELAEHAHHTAHSEGGHRDRLVSIVEASLLAIVAVLAAWSGYAAAKWGTESRLTVAEASTTRNTANTDELVALDVRIGDGLVFNAWFGAHTLGDESAMAVAERRFRPAFRTAFDAWLATDPDHNPDAPPGPQAMPEYRQPEREKAERLKHQAEALAAEGADQGQTADDYVRTTVYLATVLFLVGISTHFRVRTARIGLIVIGASMLVFSVVQLLSLPRPT